MKKTIRICTVIFVISLIGIIVIANLGFGSDLFYFLDAIPWGDKIGHFLLIGLLAFFINLNVGIKTVSFQSIKVLQGSLITSILVIAEEFSQLFLQHRGFDLIDLAFDAAGIIVFGKLAQKILKQYQESPHPIQHA